MSMTNVNINAVPMESSTTLIVCILIDGKEVLPQTLQNEEVAKGVLMGWTHVEPKNVQALNETTFLATFAGSILAEEIGAAIEKIENCLGKPAVITCDEVTMAQLPHVSEHAQHINGVESVVFNNRMDDLHSDSLQSVQNGYQSNAGGPAVLEALGTTILNKILGIPHFSGTEREKDTVWFEQWYHTISDAQKNFNEQLVRAAITRSCVGDVADAICCLPPGATLDDILEKFKWPYGYVESSATLMQEFYRIAQGKSEKVQTIVLHLERALKAIKHQHPYSMTEEEGPRHLKDLLFHRLKLNLHNALHYLYDRPDSQYSQLIMALTKAETETLGSSVSEVRAKSTVVGGDTDSQVRGASSKPSYEAIMQQIAYLMSAITIQTNPNLNKNGGHMGFKSNGNGKYPSTTFQRSKKDKKNMTCWGCGCLGHSWRGCFTPREGNNLPFRPNHPSQNQGDRQNLNG